MKYFYTLLLAASGLAAAAQNGSDPRVVARSGSSSAQVNTQPVAPPPYDMEDKYMGRKAEFLGLLTVDQLPTDFPAYEKQWSLKEYNQVVDAYLMNHQDILKPRVKEKIQLLQSRNK